MMNVASPIMEYENKGHIFDDTIEKSFQANGWCCLSQLCFGWNRPNEGETKGLLGEERETWLGERLRKAKEAKEIVAGRKWKNFIRRISKQRKIRKGRFFQYDPQSYALNFSDGVEDNNDGLLTGFSTRFACPISGGERSSGL